MEIVFPYQQEGLRLRIPDDVEIYQPACRTPISESYTAIIKNLLRPLGYKRTLFDMAKKCKSACVVVDAYCPPNVNQHILEPIIKTLHAAGMSHDDITILVASEYPSEFSDDMVKAIFSEKFLEEYNVQAHHVLAYTKHELIGKTQNGTPVYIDRRLKNADIKLITGGIYPHYLFGYAGAPLLLTLGLSGPETIQAIYNLADTSQLQDFKLHDQNSKFYSELMEIIKLTRLDFIVNILINRQFQFVDIFSGKPERVIGEIVKKLNTDYYCSIPEKADIVISCTGGPHCEISWYHNLISLCFSKSFLKEKGAIIFVTSLFEQFDSKQLSAIENKDDLIDLFLLDKIIAGTREKIFSCMDNTTIIFVSPSFDDKALKSSNNRSIYFSSSIESALQFAKQRTKTMPRTLLLPDGLLTHVGNVA